MSKSCNEWNQKSIERANVTATEVVDGELKITCITCKKVDSRRKREEDKNASEGKTDVTCFDDGDEIEKILNSLCALEKDVHTLERAVNV